MEIKMPFKEWVKTQIRNIAPHSKTVKAVDAYFATAWDDDVNVEFSRKIGGYSNHHFTAESLREFYNAEKCVFGNDFGIALTMKNP